MIRIQLRVGIPIIGGKRWLGGVSFIELHVKALSALPQKERPQLFLVIADDFRNDREYYLPFIDQFDGIIYFNGNFHTPYDITKPPMIPCTSQDDLFTKIDFYFPACYSVIPDRPAASWIPDFQHKYLPDLFSPQELAARDALCQHIAEQAKLVFCTSHSVEKDFRRFHPNSTAYTKTLPLCVSPDNNWYTGNPLKIQKQYGLPDRFILCSNQFWLHKNHRCLFQAVALLRQTGEEVHLACTGLQHDYRDRGYFQKLLGHIKELGIADLVHILGLIPRSDQIQLIRRSLLVVQPSHFEGLSLIVQECRALGKEMILSDIDIFLEYAYGTYFSRSDPQELACKMSDLLANSSPGPDLKREQAAKLQADARAKNYARDFCKLVLKAQTVFN